ncbi:MAG TPA: sugar transferase [Acidimicrobiia bacterium]|nr:sugar transferase [Acidimicrobiia bacterium]
MTVAEGAVQLVNPSRDVAVTLESSTSSPILRRALFGIDIGAIASAWLLAYAVFPAVHDGSEGWAATAGRIGAVTFVSVVLLMSQHLYRARVCSARAVEIVRLSRVAAGGALFALLAPTVTGQPASWAPVLLGGVASLLLLSGGRGFFDAWLRGERARGRFTRQVAVVGQGEEAERVIDLLHHHPELGYRVSGLVGDRQTAQKQGVAWLGSPRDAVEAILASGAGGVVLTNVGLSSADLNELMKQMLVHGLHVQVSAGLWHIDHSRLRAAPLAHEPFFYLEPPVLSARQLRLKRLLDLALALPVLLLAWPLLLVAAMAVKMQDGGPVLFRQTRIGRNGVPFTLYKFRTMAVDAEERLADLRSLNERHGPLFKLHDDPRVTRVGRILRATSIDELPQLFNVVGGTMSLVGPRPALPDEVESFDADFLARHRVPPGITGLWQLEARENASFYAYRHLDLFYVENWSCSLDLVILAGTVPSLVARMLSSIAPRRSPTVDLAEAPVLLNVSADDLSI